MIKKLPQLVSLYRAISSFVNERNVRVPCTVIGRQKNCLCFCKKYLYVKQFLKKVS